MIQWIKKVIGWNKPDETLTPVTALPAVAEVNEKRPLPIRPRPAPPPKKESPASPAMPSADAYLTKVHLKISKLADDFASGEINRAQFKKLYSHYQQEIQAIEALLEIDAQSEEWHDVITEGQSMNIRRRHAAKARGYAIYANESGMPISTLGKFKVDPDLLVPMLSSYRSATAEIFGAGMRSSEIESGRWLCFVPGELTTMMALFTAEPTTKQLNFLEQLHLLFEKANRPVLLQEPIDVDRLIFPHEHYLGKWKR